MAILGYELVRKMVGTPAGSEDRTKLHSTNLFVQQIGELIISLAGLGIAFWLVAHDQSQNIALFIVGIVMTFWLTKSTALQSSDAASRVVSNLFYQASGASATSTRQTEIERKIDQGNSQLAALHNLLNPTEAVPPLNTETGQTANTTLNK